MANMILMILFIVVAFGVFGFSLYKMMQLVKHPMPKTIDYKVEIKKFLYLVGAAGVATVLLFIFLSMFQSYPLSAGEWVSLVFGSLFFGLSLPTFVLSFILHYYGKEVDPKLKHRLFITMLVSAFFICLGLILLTTSFADYIPYPLVNGISFTKGFVTPASGSSPNVAWYALCILSGAVLVYFICDHRYYVEYGVHGVVESTFLVAFPAGIVGARLGYVIGEWNHGSFATRIANGEWWAPLAIWEGGLTVISGALVGIIVGVIWFMWRNKKYSIWMAVDIIVPTILIAQAVGRWGNFFNCEVHGFQVSADSWTFLPKIILNNARYSDTVGWASNGNIFIPLFFIESLTNLAGYVFIRFIVGKGLRKYIELGDLAFLYIAWYGLTRVIMEPLRDTHYNMGNDGYWSWIWSIIFVLIATACILVNHIVRFIIEERKGTGITIKKSLTGGLTVGGSLLSIATLLIAFGAIYMSKGEKVNFIAFNNYSNGLIMLVVGLSVFMIALLSIPYIYRGFKVRKTVNEQ